ncbi:predicted protein [Botrytis cinerea T4]|uniref:Uncharacterized protein n=1 Tax=Botryotinia fuckeliana (strain T4) TaxID=999810 RepID=G2XXG7_BOTF4|nr:predicted protein [Botrytis cinerea T4]
MSEYTEGSHLGSLEGFREKSNQGGKELSDGLICTGWSDEDSEEIEFQAKETSCIIIHNAAKK